jgi:hypothetical protein
VAANDQKPEETFALAIESDAFRKAARLFEGWIPRNQMTARAALWLDQVDLVIRIGNDEARVAADGTWPGIVIMAAGFLIAESTGLPDSGQIQLSVDADRIRLETQTGSRTVACQVLANAPEWPEFIEQLAPFTMLEYLLLPQRFSAASIEYSGLADEVAGCVSSLGELVDHLHDAIYEAATILELDPAQVREALAFLVGPGLEQPQRRKT